MRTVHLPVLILSCHSSHHEQIVKISDCKLHYTMNSFNFSEKFTGISIHKNVAQRFRVVVHGRNKKQASENRIL